MLEISKLTCLRGGRQLFHGVNFKVNPGDVVHVQGCNGSGKTSLLRILTGLALQDSGFVNWCDKDIRQFREEYVSNLLYLGHSPAVKDDLSVRENLKVSLRLAGIRSDDESLKEVLEKVGLAGRLTLPARVLSQGQRRRLALARLWLDNRTLWVLDEPFTALDTHAIGLLEERIEQHAAGGGMVILTTHQRPAISETYLRVLSVGT